MTKIDRRSFLSVGFGVAGMGVLAPLTAALGQSSSLSDVGTSIVPLPKVTIFKAKEIVTLDPARPKAEAVAVVNGRILLVGSLEEVQSTLKGQRHFIDTTFADKVIGSSLPRGERVTSQAPFLGAASSLGPCE